MKIGSFNSDIKKCTTVTAPALHQGVRNIGHAVVADQVRAPPAATDAAKAINLEKVVIGTAPATETSDTLALPAATAVVGL